MRILALDTTTRAGSVAILHDDTVLVERVGDAARSHAERLPRELLEALGAVGLTTADIDLFAVASGPGMFTGLRIGIATIQGLAFVHQRPVAPVSALRALGVIAAREVAPGTRAAAWMDAHRRDVFSALFLREPDATGAGPVAVTEIDPAAVDAPAATLQRWGSTGPLPAVICGDGAVAFQALLPPTVRALAPPPLASTLARLARADHEAGRTVAPSAVLPLYVRRPDAEVARDAAARR